MLIWKAWSGSHQRLFVLEIQYLRRMERLAPINNEMRIFQFIVEIGPYCIVAGRLMFMVILGLGT